MTGQEEFRQRVIGLGFDVVRFVRLDALSQAPGEALERWFSDGSHAGMEWMPRSTEKRRDPQQVLPGAKSALLLGVNYWSAGAKSQGPVWARYATYEDYHDTLRGALVAAGRALEDMFGLSGTDYRYYVDTGPVLERSWSERGGVGFIGKNAMLISRDFGNWLFLAEILTTLDFAADPPLGAALPAEESAGAERIGLYCGSCTRCMDACPTGAIKRPGYVDARLCISYQTIENKGVIPRELRAQIGARIYGCDTCLDVCPWNRFAQESRRVLLNARYDLNALTLRDVLELTPERFAEVFRRTPIKRTKLAGILRNACIVAGNTGAVDCLDVLVRLASEAAALVRAHAVWAVFRLLPREAAAARLAAARERETDENVIAEYEAELPGAETPSVSSPQG